LIESHCRYLLSSSEDLLVNIYDIKNNYKLIKSRKNDKIIQSFVETYKYVGIVGKEGKLTFLKINEDFMEYKSIQISSGSINDCVFNKNANKIFFSCYLEQKIKSLLKIDVDTIELAHILEDQMQNIFEVAKNSNE